MKIPMAMQFLRPKRDPTTRKTKQQKKKQTKRTVEIVRPWTLPQYEELEKEERDIVLDRLQKEVVDVPSTRSHVVQGVKQVAKAIVKGKLRVVIFANSPESLTYGHLPLLCRLHQVPICVLHLASKTFGRLFRLKSMTAVGIKGPTTTNESAAAMNSEERNNNAVNADTASRVPNATKLRSNLTKAELTKLQSSIEFFVSKASKRMM